MTGMVIETEEGVSGREDHRVVLVESRGIDSEPFDMLICFLTALIAPSSHRGLQRKDAFQRHESRGEKRISFHFYSAYAASAS